MRNELLTMIGLCVCCFSCGKKNSLRDYPKIAIEKAVLESPTSNECIQSPVQANKMGLVMFRWDKSSNAKRYKLIVENLANGEKWAVNIEGMEQNISLPRDFPYSWSVTSYGKNSQDSTVSESRKFYYSGNAVGYSIPFPADSLDPSIGAIIIGENGQISLKWKGLDVDNDIVGYDVYFGEDSSSLSLLKRGIAVDKVEHLEVQHNKVYYWKVITKDSEGNTSDSGIYQFWVTDKR